MCVQEKDRFDGCAALFQEEMRSSGLAWNGLGIIKENGRENKGQPIETANRLLGFSFLFPSHSFTVFFPFFHPGRSLWHLNSQLASDIDWPIKWPFLLFICMVADWYLFYFRYSWQLMTMWCWRLTSVSTDQFSLSVPSSWLFSQTELVSFLVSTHELTNFSREVDSLDWLWIAILAAGHEAEGDDRRERGPRGRSAS